MSSSAPVVERPDGAVFAKAAVIPRGTPFVNDLSKAQVCLECVSRRKISPLLSAGTAHSATAADAAHATPAFGARQPPASGLAAHSRRSKGG